MADEKLVAACGTYCGACEMYRGVKDNNKAKLNKTIGAFKGSEFEITLSDIECDGCLAGGKVTPWCRFCAMKSCPKHKDDNGICSPACPDFPCDTLKAFSTDNMDHHHEVIDRLRHLYEVGLKQHAEDEEKRWTCPQCGQKFAWYDSKCPACGGPRPEGLFEVHYEWDPRRYSQK